MELAFGPGRLYLGDPTQAGGAGMTNIGDHEDVTFNPNMSSAFATSANSGDQPIVGSLRNRPSMAQLSAGLLDIGREALMAVLSTHMEELSADTDADGTPDTYAIAPKESAIITPYTLAFVPEPELGQGAAAPHAVWLSAAYPSDVGDLLQYGRLTDGDNASPFTCTWNAALPGDGLSTDVPWFRGDPASLGLTWSLPTP